MPSKSLYIFDLDGTLVDAYRAIHKSLLFTLDRFGYPPATFEASKMAVGRGDRNFILSFFDPKDEERAVKTFKKHHASAVADHSKVLPYARYTLHRLKQKGKMLAVATNRPGKFTRIIIRALDLKKYFDAIVSADDVKAWKPDPKMLNMLRRKFGYTKKECVFIGDTGIDLETAQNAGLDAFFVTGGSSHLKDIQKYKNKRVIKNLREILKYD